MPKMNELFANCCERFGDVVVAHNSTSKQLSDVHV